MIWIYGWPSTIKRAHTQASTVTARHRTFLDSVPLAQEKIIDSLSTPAPEPERSHVQRSAGEGAADQV